jgi:5,10-methylene-tetrahydrofolate dehydrogenase/methenyl tetrahydrofolate cyclohydrolase
MFAPKVNKPQTKTAASTTSKLAARHSMIGTRPSGGGTVEQVHVLQHAIGNQATLRLLAQQTSSLTVDESYGDHEQEVKPEGMQIQRKARVTAPDDQLEREADQVAELVTSGKLAGAIDGTPSSGVQPKCAACDAKEEQHILREEQASAAGMAGGARAEPAVDVLRSSGVPLSAGQRAYFEPRFEHDFGSVRVHTDPESAALSRQLGARAFAMGNHIAFAGEERSQVAPGSYLLAHELAHVVQQRHAGVARVMRQATEEERKSVVAPPCPGSCHVHVEHYQSAFGSGLGSLRATPLEAKQVPLSQMELQALYDWIARSSPGPVSRDASLAPTSNELTGGQLKADVANEYAKHEQEFKAKPNNRVQIIRFEVPDESDPDWSKYKASEISSDQKKKTFAALGLRPEEKVFPRSVPSRDFSAYIAAQNADAMVFGIIVQLPTPPQLRADVGTIAPGKDLDALSAGKGRTFKAPATAEGVVRIVLAMLKPGQTVAVIGGGRDPGFGALGFVGGAVVELLRDRGITVRVFEKDDDLREVKKYDLVVSAVGTPRLVKKEHLKPEHELVVDTGFVPEKGGKPVGDVEESARSIPRYITAVPGGTGPIEMAALMERAAKLLGIKVRTWQVELRDGKLRAVFVE